MTVTTPEQLADIVALIDPCDSVEVEHRNRVLDWIRSGAPLYRIRKPDDPAQHLVSYFAVTNPADGSLLLVDHINAGLLLPPGGHCEPGEAPWQTVQRECGEELAIEARPTSWLGDRPLFVTVTATRDPHGVLGVHTDISLWFVIEAPTGIVTYDKTEFTSLHWMTPQQILATPPERLDPHMHRFTRKYLTARA